MAFPSTPVLDNFNRADTGPPPSASWTCPFFGDPGSFTVVSNQMVGNNAAFNSGFWNVQQFPPPIEVFLTVAGFSDQIYVEFASGNMADPSGYALLLRKGALTWTLFRNNTGVAATTLTTGSYTFAGSDQFGLSLDTDGTVNAWKNGVSFATVTDTTYAGPFYLGTEINTTATQIDDFGGGSLARATFAPHRMPLGV